MVAVITIDGPSGSGKGTISQLLAVRIGWHFLDSGSIYRILAFAALETGISLKDVVALSNLANTLKVKYEYAQNGGYKIILQKRDITEAIRSEQCSMAASTVAALPEVRAALLAWQRGFCRLPGLVADGRDMGTVVFPTAQLKMFLTASVEKRAERRYKQLKLQGFGGSLPEILQDLIARDDRDQKRAVAPLMAAKDVYLIDTTSLTVDEVLAKVLALVARVFGDI